MEPRKYLIARRLFFWLFFIMFVVFTPAVVFYSLGYKLDLKTKKFLKTGIISIKTFPKGVDVYLDGKKHREASPCIIREAMPNEYVVTLEKNGFYTYSVPIEVKPSIVSDIDVILVPEMRNVEKLKFNFNVYRFFFNKHFFGDKIVIFTDKGVYFLDSDFKGIEKISSKDFGADVASAIVDLKESNNRLMFYSDKNVWFLEFPQDRSSKEKDVMPVYKADEFIKDAFFGIRDRYLVIQDGLKVIAMDIQNPAVVFPIFQLRSINSKVFYDNRAEILYIRDKVMPAGTFSFFRIELMPLINEKREKEATIFNLGT